MPLNAQIASFPIRLSLNDVILITTALEHHRQIFAQAGRTDEAGDYQHLINRLETQSLPASVQTNDNPNRCLHV